MYNTYNRVQEYVCVYTYVYTHIDCLSKLQCFICYNFVVQLSDNTYQPQNV